MSDYSRFLHRLNAYREKHGLTQEEMGELLGVHQSHYGRLEAEERIVTFKSLRHFVEKGGDLFQLLTGCKHTTSVLEQLLERCATDDGKQKLLGLLVWGVEFGNWVDNRDREEATAVLHKAVRLLDLQKGTYTIWESIRKVEDLTQMEMAEALNMEVKRYRRIEKEEIEPDVETLFLLYERFRYSPQMFFNKEKFFLDELNFYWNLLKADTRENLMKIFETAVVRIQAREACS